jgi:hypothetical protein
MLEFEAGCVCAAPRLRQSLAALVFGYGLNEEEPVGFWLTKRSRLAFG